ncbi:MAG: hypothetical protein Q3983_03475 [Capnocytophaga sp.]|nr:hypothetical protein [Capnocytophaga sp.]
MKSSIFLSVIALSIISCNNIDKKFLITNDSVGVLSKNNKTSQLDSIYAKDSLVKSAFDGEFRYASQERFSIFDKNGEKKQLLELTPTQPNEDKTQYIANIQIMDARFKTENGISLESTFADIKKVYSDFDFEQSLTTVVVMPKNSNLYFAFDKSDLIASISGDFTINDIPDTAKIKRLMVSWTR